MRQFKIATWNVNSLRVRLPHLLDWLKENKPDAIALQETKMIDADFPLDVLQDAGYAAIFSGQKTYNGVAILWREKGIDIHTSFPGFDDPARRVLGVTLQDIRVLDLYVPNGQSLTSDKYQYKLNWLYYLETYLKGEIKKYPRLIMLGDFNIAPADIDVHDPARWEGSVLCSELEREAIKKIKLLGFQDCFRTLHPTEKSFSWWDYRMNAFKRNMGLRIDHIFASEMLAPYCVNCFIDKIPRSWERPSDHAPVIAEFKFN